MLLFHLLLQATAGTPGVLVGLQPLLARPGRFDGPGEINLNFFYFPTSASAPAP
jgi:hypothetical protein